MREREEKKMVNFMLMITAELENLTNLQPQDGCDDPNFSYLFKVPFFLSLSKSNSKFNISLINFSFLISSIFFFSVVIVEMREMRRTEPERNLRRLKRHRSSPRWQEHHSSHSKGYLKCPLRFFVQF